MQSLFLLLVFFALVFACPLAYPITNNTLTRREIINGTLPLPDIINGTEELDTGGHAGFPINAEKRWPRGLAHEVVIPWCFKDAQSEQVLGATIDRAWETWTRTLGQASVQNGHNLQLKRWMPFNTNTYPYCYDANGQWHNRVPPDAVCVSYVHGYLPNYMARATPGYKASDNTPGRHEMIFTQEAMNTNPEHTAAHELGHVFGLLHEHQRSDRDYYIHYECRNVVGYQEALRKARADGYTSEQLCNQPGVAQIYGWGGSEFIRFPPVVADMVTPYDVHSIMHYDCRHGSDHAIWGPDPTNPTLYPMYMFNEEGTEALLLPSKGLRPYPHFDISAGDAAAIRAIYPFYPDT